MDKLLVIRNYSCGASRRQSHPNGRVYLVEQNFNVRCDRSVEVRTVAFAAVASLAQRLIVVEPVRAALRERLSVVDLQLEPRRDGRTPPADLTRVPVALEDLKPRLRRRILPLPLVHDFTIDPPPLA
jgi:hypothetical protein